jgi:hypothetical protein
MFTNIVIVLAAIVLVFLVVVAMRPDTFRVARSVNIAAPSSAIFPRVDDFHKWIDWSPYEKLDPAMKRSYEGATAGAGSTYSWVGNSKAGEGRATITESRPGELVRIKLEFFKPFACNNTADFTFQPEGDQTAVTWSLSGKNNFMAKAVGLFMNMDKMIGGQFEEGLAQLKSVSEAAPRN